MVTGAVAMDDAAGVRADYNEDQHEGQIRCWGARNRTLLVCVCLFVCLGLV